MKTKHILSRLDFPVFLCVLCELRGRRPLWTWRGARPHWPHWPQLLSTSGWPPWLLPGLTTELLGLGGQPRCGELLPVPDPALVSHSQPHHQHRPAPTGIIAASGNTNLHLSSLPLSICLSNCNALSPQVRLVENKFL